MAVECAGPELGRGSRARPRLHCPVRVRAPAPRAPSRVAPSPLSFARAPRGSAHPHSPCALPPSAAIACRPPSWTAPLGLAAAGGRAPSARLLDVPRSRSPLVLRDPAARFETSFLSMHVSAKLAKWDEACRLRGSRPDATSRVVSVPWASSPSLAESPRRGAGPCRREWARRAWSGRAEDGAQNGDGSLSVPSDLRGGRQLRGAPSACFPMFPCARVWAVRGA